jgi:O-antigen ligase
VTASLSQRGGVSPRWPLIALGAVSLGAGFAVIAGGRVLLVVTALVVLVGAVAAATLIPVDRRAAAVDVIVMIGLLAPVADQQDRTGSQISSSPLTPLAVVQGILPALCLLAVLLLVRPQSLRPTAVELWLGAFLFAAAMSTVWSVAPAVTFLKAAQLALAYLLVLLWIRVSPPGRDLVAQLGTLVHAVLLCVLAGLLISPGSAIVPIPGPDPTPRLRGIFPVIAPDLLGFMAVIGILYLAACVGPRWTLRREVRVALAVAYAVMLVLTRARISLVLLALGLVVLLLQDARRRSGLPFLLPLLGVAGVCVLSLYAGQITTFVGRGASSEALSTLTGRTITWDQALDAWKQQPLTGYGFYSGHRLGAFSAIDAQNLDSMWIETLLDVGLIGTVALVGLVIAGARSLHRHGRGGVAPSQQLATAIFATALASSFVNPSLQQANYPMIVFAVVLLVRWPAGPGAPAPATDGGTLSRHPAPASASRRS